MYSTMMDLAGIWLNVPRGHLENFHCITRRTKKHVQVLLLFVPVCVSVSTVCGAQETPLLWTSGVHRTDLFFSSLETV